jgi:hypothetical protein
VPVRKLAGGTELIGEIAFTVGEDAIMEALGTPVYSPPEALRG